MMRFRTAGFGAGLLLGLVGITLHSDPLIWAGIAVLGVVFVLRFVKRDQIVHH